MQPHQKKGELPTVSTQPPHQVSSQPFQNPDSRPANSQSLTAKSYFYETNPHQIERPPQAGLLYLTPVFQPGIPPRHKNVKRTQFHPAKIRNEPNFIPLVPLALCANYAKRTQFASSPLSADPKIRNEPNLPLPQPGPRSKYAKRTQFATPTIKKCETNPIPASHPSHPAGRRSVPTCRETQFIVPPPSRWLHRVPKIRNEPNFRTDSVPPPSRQPPQPQICETNPIPPGQKPTANSQHPKNAKRTQSRAPEKTANLSTVKGLRQKSPHSPLLVDCTSLLLGFGHNCFAHALSGVTVEACEYFCEVCPQEGQDYG